MNESRQARILAGQSSIAQKVFGYVPKSEGALDVLASLSGEVVTLADDFSQRMKVLAGRIEEVALSVEAEREGNAEALGKLKQLQSLLKGISE